MSGLNRSLTGTQNDGFEDIAVKEAPVGELATRIVFEYHEGGGFDCN